MSDGRTIEYYNSRWDSLDCATERDRESTCSFRTETLTMAKAHIYLLHFVLEEKLYLSLGAKRYYNATCLLMVVRN